MALVFDMVVFPLCQTSIPVTPTSRGNLKVYQLPSQNLEPSTTYVVCVRSYSGWSGRYSDCSAEAEFTTRECVFFFNGRSAALV